MYHSILSASRRTQVQDFETSVAGGMRATDEFIGTRQVTRQTRISYERHPDELLGDLFAMLASGTTEF